MVLYHHGYSGALVDYTTTRVVGLYTIGFLGKGFLVANFYRSSRGHATLFALYGGGFIGQTIATGDLACEVSPYGRVKLLFYVFGSFIFRRGRPCSISFLFFIST